MQKRRRLSRSTSLLQDYSSSDAYTTSLWLMVDIHTWFIPPLYNNRRLPYSASLFYTNSRSVIVKGTAMEWMTRMIRFSFICCIPMLSFLSPLFHLRVLPCEMNIGDIGGVGIMTDLTWHTWCTLPSIVLPYMPWCTLWPLYSLHVYSLGSTSIGRLVRF